MCDSERVGGGLALGAQPGPDVVREYKYGAAIVLYPWPRMWLLCVNTT